jgi:hypothetical protein
MRSSLAPLFAALLVACGSSSDPSAAEPHDAAGGTDEVDIVDGGARDAPPTVATRDAVLAMTEFTVPAGGEVYKCQNFASPFEGDAEIVGFESHMTGGSHHLLLFYDPSGKDAPLEDCSGLEFSATPYGTQRPDDAVTYPAGVASKIGLGFGYRLQAHYLNTTANDLVAHVQVVLHAATDPSTIVDHAGVYFFVQPDIHVAPHSKADVSRRCRIPYDANILQTGSHMHQHATHFVSKLNGDVLYETNDWDSPEPAIFAPPKAVKAGDIVDFTCSFDNPTGDTLTFGESAAQNEMCITSAQFYPVASPFQPTVPCMD